MSELAPTERTTLKRLPQRGAFDRETMYGILDEGFVCHVGFVVEGQPFIIPTAYGRAGDELFIHGSRASRMLKALRGGIQVCVTVTLVDGLVLARSAFHHSMNYRSVVVFGNARVVESDEEKLSALRSFTEHVAPARWQEVRPPNRQELNSTLVLALPLKEASAKLRTGPPVDDKEDYALPVWAGVVPLTLEAGEAIPDPRLPAGTPLSASLEGFNVASRPHSNTR
ncbi:MAG: pyridoxamine 5'-phosphate oxidase family protein [Acidobacteria bacterium]|nr:pyridoxamine 5'-phosphate oxidase family protein [Acidobacteriota bacterium]